MVFEDLSIDENKTIRQYLRLAMVSDRLLAFIFDIIFLTPVVGLMMSGMYKKIQMMSYLNPEGLDLNITLLVSAVFIFLLASLLQTFFLLLWQATPGQIFFKIKVVSVDQHLSKMRLTQILLRSFVFSSQFLFLGIPFLVVLGDKHRRGLHDRIAGTLVLTLKKVGDPGPTALETAFVHKMLLLTSIGAIMMVSLSVSHFYQSIEHDLHVDSDHDNTQAQHICPQIPSIRDEDNNQSSVIHKIDQVVSMYLTQEVSGKCLQQTIKSAFFSEDPQVQNWAYFAKWIQSVSDVQTDIHITEKYLERICIKDSIQEYQSELDLCKLAQASANFLNEKISLSQRKIASEEIENKYWVEVAKSPFDIVAILSMKRDLKNGHLQSYQEKLGKWSEINSANEKYKNYISENLVKTYWMNGENEKALGAYESTRSFLPQKRQEHLDAWLCYEQSTPEKSCIPSSACQHLQQKLKNESYLATTDNEGTSSDLNLAILALAQRVSCSKAALDPLELNTMQSISEEPSLNLVVNSILKNKIRDGSNFDSSAVKKIAAYKNNESLQPYALRELVSKVKNEQDFLFIIEQMKMAPMQDYNWQKNYYLLLQGSLLKNDHHQMGLLLGLTPEHLTPELKKQMIVALFQLKKYDKAWFLASALDNSSKSGMLNSGRSPASESAPGFESVYDSLRKRFRP